MMLLEEKKVEEDHQYKLNQHLLLDKEEEKEL